MDIKIPVPCVVIIKGASVDELNNFYLANYTFNEELHFSLEKEERERLSELITRGTFFGILVTLTYVFSCNNFFIFNLYVKNEKYFRMIHV